jgi:hypothetical protein
MHAASTGIGVMGLGHLGGTKLDVQTTYGSLLLQMHCQAQQRPGRCCCCCVIQSSFSSMTPELQAANRPALPKAPHLDSIVLKLLAALD